MEVAPAPLNSRAAIEAAFREFETMFPEMSNKRVLLEGLEYLENQNRWSVVFGFDSERPKQDKFRDFSGSAAAQLGARMFAEQEIVREFRKFIIDGTSGALVKMDHA